MQNQGDDFLPFVKQQKRFILVALVTCVVYFIVIQLLYPVPSFFADSYTFVGAASRNQPVSFRPVMYSKLIQFFHLFSTSDVALIAAQYLATVLANLFLFLSTCWLFGFKKWYKYLLFALLICHPFYVFFSNYVSSDAFFTSFTVVWFTLLLWIMYKPTWYIIGLHIALLVLLFTLRYNSIYFPVFTTLALLFTKLKWYKKPGAITISVVLLAGYVELTSRTTKSYTRTRTFSPFAGWQLANNALHVVRNERIDPSLVKDPEVKNLLVYNQHFFDTTKDYIPAKGSAWYMWHPNSPLKKYMNVYAPRSNYFNTWVALGPVYEKFGKAIIFQHPMGYVRHFVLPNTAEYIYPELEVYETYMEGKDTIAPIAKKYFNYTSNKASIHRPLVYAAVFGPWPFLFTCSNLLLIFLGTWYFISGRYKTYSKLVNRFVFLFAAYFIANFFFIVLLAPSVFRYHLPVLLLSMPVILFFISATGRRTSSARMTYIHPEKM